MRARCAVVAVLTACGSSSLTRGPDASASHGDIDAMIDVRSGDASSTVRVADVVFAAPGGGGTKAVNGVRGAGTAAGSGDVYSLGYQPNVNDSIAVTWSSGS